MRVDDEVGMEVERLIDIVDNAQEHGGLEDEEPLEATLQGRLCHLGHAARHEEEILQLLQEEILEKEKENIANKKQPSSSEVMVLSLRRR